MAAFSITGLIREARRRRVFRVIALYIVGAWGALQIADLVFPGIGVDESAIRYVWIAAVLGFPVALVVGWRYDIVGGRVVRTAADDSDAKLAIGRTDYFILAGLALVVATITFRMVAEITQTRTTERPVVAAAITDPNSVAVLPFANLSGSADNEYLSDGLTETLLHAIAQVPDLKVPARTSSFYYKGRDIDIREIAIQLGVAYVLEGSVQRAGNTLRVVAQLIDAETGLHRWSRTYDRDMHDIFAVQDDIANSVVREMRSTLSATAGLGGDRIEGVSTKNEEAYEIYLKGLQQKNILSFEQLALAEISFKKALLLDPEFFEAHVELAQTYVEMFKTHAIGPREAYEKLLPLVNQLRAERPGDVLVLSLAANLALARANDPVEGNLDVDGYLGQLSAAVERAPNEPRLYLAITDILQFGQRNDEALRWAERGLEIDPHNWDLLFQRAWLLRIRGDLDASLAAFARAMELNPDNPSIPANAAMIHLERKQYAQWFALMRKSVDLDPLDPSIAGYLGFMLDYLGLTEEGAKYMQRAKSITNEEERQGAKMRSLLKQADYLRASEISEALLRNYEDLDRQDIWWASLTFVSAMAELGEIESALQVLEEILPGVASPDFEAQNIAQQSLQYFAVLGFAEIHSEEETQRLLDAVVPRWVEDDPTYLGSQGRGVAIAWARGDRSGAIEQALAHVAANPMLYRNIYFWKPVAREPEVAARLAEIDAEREKAAEEIWDYIVEHNLQL